MAEQKIPNFPPKKNILLRKKYEKLIKLTTKYVSDKDQLDITLDTKSETNPDTKKECISQKDREECNKAINNLRKSIIISIEENDFELLLIQLLNLSEKDIHKQFISKELYPYIHEKFIESHNGYLKYYEKDAIKPKKILINKTFFTDMINWKGSNARNGITTREQLKFKKDREIEEKYPFLFSKNNMESEFLKKIGIIDNATLSTGLFFMRMIWIVQTMLCYRARAIKQLINLINKLIKNIPGSDRETIEKKISILVSSGNNVDHSWNNVSKLFTGKLEENNFKHLTSLYESFKDLKELIIQTTESIHFFRFLLDVSNESNFTFSDKIIHALLAPFSMKKNTKAKKYYNAEEAVTLLLAAYGMKVKSTNIKALRKWKEKLINTVVETINLFKENPEQFLQKKHCAMFKKHFKACGINEKPEMNNLQAQVTRILKELRTSPDKKKKKKIFSRHPSHNTYSFMALSKDAQKFHRALESLRDTEKYTTNNKVNNYIKLRDHFQKNDLFFSSSCMKYLASKLAVNNKKSFTTTLKNVLIDWSLSGCPDFNELAPTSSPKLHIRPNKTTTRPSSKKRASKQRRNSLPPIPPNTQNLPSFIKPPYPSELVRHPKSQRKVKNVDPIFFPPEKFVNATPSSPKPPRRTRTTYRRQNTPHPSKIRDIVSPYITPSNTKS